MTKILINNNSKDGNNIRNNSTKSTNNIYVKIIIIIIINININISSHNNDDYLGNVDDIWELLLIMISKGS